MVTFPGFPSCFSSDLLHFWNRRRVGQILSNIPEGYGEMVSGVCACEHMYVGEGDMSVCECISSETLPFLYSYKHTVRLNSVCVRV